jgi:hypothetical protein
MPLAGLAEELGLSHRQFGMGLGLLIREGQIGIDESAKGLLVRLAKAPGQAKWHGKAEGETR